MFTRVLFEEIEQGRNRKISIRKNNCQISAITPQNKLRTDGWAVAQGPILNTTIAKYKLKKRGNNSL